MARSVLFLDTYYFSLLESLGLERVPNGVADYAEELVRALDFGFGTGGAYARNMRTLGWDAQVIVPNSLTLQLLWARDHGDRRPWTRGWKYGPHLARLPVANRLLHVVPHLHGVLLEQIARLKPDVVYVQDINLLPPALSMRIRAQTKLLVGEIASPLPPTPFVRAYDHLVSALPSIVERAHQLGIPATGIPLGFDERWATVSPASSRPIDAAFIGSFSRLQPQTVPLMRAVATLVPGLRIYGPADDKFLRQNGLIDNYHGPAWGREMFGILGQSKMVINRHGTIAGDYAVNMRMYEATGSGAALITEDKSTLGELFVPGQEVVAYTDPQDAATKAAALLADPTRLDRIALAGQERTLSTHTYAARARVLDGLLITLLSEQHSKSAVGRARRPRATSPS